MKNNKLWLSAPLSAGLLLAGCGTDEQDPPPETEGVELEDNHMEEGNNEDSEMQGTGTSEESDKEEPGMNEESSQDE